MIVQGKRFQKHPEADRETQSISHDFTSGDHPQEPLSDPNVRTPNALIRTARNAMLLASTIVDRRKWKNLALAVSMLGNRKARSVWTKHFDDSWYRRTHIDITRSGVSSTLHYLVCGHLEGRAPSSGFDAGFYLRRHSDVRSAGLNPLLHYALFGVHEDRTTVAPLNAPPRVRCFRSYRQDSPSGSNSPLVTVVIPCFNYGRYLAEALQSGHEQTLPGVQIVVVEGGSTDSVTPATVREIEKSSVSAVRFLYRSEPHLPGDNRNFGILQSTTEYVCCLDADDRLMPHYLEVAAFLMATYGYDLVYPSVQAFEGDDFVWRLHDANPNTITEFNQVSTVALFRRAAWSEVEGYRDFGRGEEHVAEDWDFWVRLLRKGFRAKSIPQPLHLYRVHVSGLWHGAKSSVEYQRRCIQSANAEALACDTVSRPLAPKPDRWRALLQTPIPSTGAILLALPFVTIGGAEKIFEAIIRSETAQGRKVVVITSLTLSDSAKDIAAYFQTLTPYFYALPALFEEDTAVWDDFISYLIDQYSIDLILISGSDYMYHSLPHIAKAFPHVGVVDQLFNDQVHFPTNRHYAAYIDVTMVPSPVFANRIIGEFGASADDIAVIPHGVNIPSLNEFLDLAQLRRSSGLPSDWSRDFLIGFFGRMSPEKAPADFIEIVRKLASEPGMRFVMTGEGPELERVRQLIHRYGLSDRIYAPGFVDDPRSLMMAVDIVVVPSRLDGMPLVVMESQAIGKAVIASAVGSIPVMIEHGRTGMLCPAGDLLAFADTIRRLRNTPEITKQLGRAAREWAESNHSSAAMLRRYDKAFERAREIRRTKAT